MSRNVTPTIHLDERAGTLREIIRGSFGLWVGINVLRTAGIEETALLQHAKTGAMQLLILIESRKL
jgi:hypothetical protein